MTGLWCIVPQSKLTLHGNLGLVSGIVNTICITFDSLAQFIFGVLLDYYWSGKYIKDNGIIWFVNNKKETHINMLDLVSIGVITKKRTPLYGNLNFYKKLKK